LVPSLHLCSKDYGYFHICLDKHLPYILQYKSPGSYINFPAICSNSITLVHYSQSSLLVIFLILILILFLICVFIFILLVIIFIVLVILLVIIEIGRAS